MSVEVTRLNSGLSVVTDAMPHLKTASLGVWVGSGSRHERPDEHGISHLLEHMAFKGTARRTARQIAEEIEAVGGDLNAATGIESTAYYARTLAADVPLALDVQLADWAHDPVARTLGDDAGEGVEVMLSRDCGGGIKMEGERRPLVGVDQVHLCAEVAVAAQLWEEWTGLEGNA